MLDFYLINDNQNKPDYPEEKGLEFVGNLDYKTFNNLKNKNLINPCFDYYADFRWDMGAIKQLYHTISKKQLKTDSDVAQLIKLLDAAMKNKSGLIAYAD